MTINFYANTSERETLNKALALQFSVDVTVKDECDLINPTFRIQKSLSDLATVNYIYVPAFHRYYYVNTTKTLTNQLSEIDCHVDVLMSYKNEILEQTAIITRGERSDTYNLDINDGSLKVYQDRYTLTKAFPNSFENTNYILLVSGDGSLEQQSFE